MRVIPCFLAVALAMATSAMAQPSSPVDSTDCTAAIAAVEQEMDVARSKGQMLRRRQLSEDLSALQARCKASPVGQGRAAAIERLEQEIRDMRSAIERAEDELRKLKSQGS